MRVREFHSEIWLPLPPEQVFPFFADAANLDLITPEWLNFHTVTPLPIEMRVGTQIDYKLRIHGFPVRWRTLISAWEPPFRFVDEQLRGPYRQWIHEHTFAARDCGTLMTDHVRYAVFCDWLVHGLFVRGDIEKIFAARSVVLAKHFGKGNARETKLPG
jgi:ligand-binding SRPBCC domain-containing protein